jgi:hypothetical protein
MIKSFEAYVDGSGSGDQEMLVIAGYVAPAAEWQAFSKQWKAQLEEARLPYVKMSELAASRMEIAAWFYRLIEQFGITAAISCAVRTGELRKAIDEYKWPVKVTGLERIKNPYFFGFKAITDMLAQYQGQLGIDEPVDFIFDDQSESADLKGLWAMLKLSSAPEFRKNMGREPMHKSDIDAVPLQAADMWAWWVRKWCKENVSNWGKTLPFPWGMRRDIRRLHVDFYERDFITEWDNAFRPEARGRWNITDPDAALKELEEREVKN